MTLPPYRPPDYLADVLGQLKAATSFLTALKDVNDNQATHKSSRIELTHAALESLVNAIAIVAQLQDQLRSDVAELAVVNFKGNLNAENQMTAYKDTQVLIERGMRQAEDATDGLTASRGLRKALDPIIGLVDALMWSVRSLKHTAVKVDALNASLAKLRQDVTPLIEAHAERQRQIDNWLDDALKGSNDATPTD